MDMPLLQTIRDLGLPPPTGIVQVGASSGQEMGEFLRQGVRRGIFIEPLPQPFELLAGVCRRIPNFIAVNTLCTATTGQTVDFHVASNGGQSSSTLEPLNHLSQFDYVKFDKKIQLVGNRLDDVITFVKANGHARACEPIDLIYMDTQGSELQVLEGAPRTLATARYVITEVTRNQLYKGAPTLAELSAYLEGRGYALNNVNFNRHHCADALYVKRETIGLTAGR
jgi:FkbM family methyltransferase